MKEIAKGGFGTTVRAIATGNTRKLHNFHSHLMIVLALGQHVPAQGRELACNRDGGDLMTAARPDWDEEGPQWPGCFRRCPSRLDQHCVGMAATSLADPAMMG